MIWHTGVSEKFPYQRWTLRWAWTNDTTTDYRQLPPRSCHTVIPSSRSLSTYHLAPSNEANTRRASTNASWEGVKQIWLWSRLSVAIFGGRGQELVILRRVIIWWVSPQVPWRLWMCVFATFPRRRHVYMHIEPLDIVFSPILFAEMWPFLSSSGSPVVEDSCSGDRIIDLVLQQWNNICLPGLPNSLSQRSLCNSTHLLSCLSWGEMDLVCCNSQRRFGFIPLSPPPNFHLLFFDWRAGTSART